jgi:ankyrin repeat protein
MQRRSLVAIWRILKWTLVVIAVDIALLVTVQIGVVPYPVLARPTPLMDAAMRADPDRLRQLLATGSNLDARRGRSWRLGVCFIAACPPSPESYGQTALMLAVDAQSPPAVRVLLEGGARIEVQNSAGEDAVDRAIAHLGSEEGREIYRLLVADDPPGLRESAANAALMESARFGLTDIAREVLPRVRNPEAIELAMCTASGAASVEMLDLLRTRLGRVPDRLVDCVNLDDFETVRYLLDHGLDPNARHQQGTTLLARLVLRMPAMHYQTCRCEQLVQVRIVQLLLRRGADPTLSPAGVPNALQVAERGNKPDIVALLKTGKPVLHTPAGESQSCPTNCLETVE